MVSSMIRSARADGVPWRAGPRAEDRGWHRFAARVVGAAVLLCTSLATLAAPADAPLIAPLQPGIRTGAPFDADKRTRKSVSGIACAPAGATRRCVVVFDEGIRAQFATLSADALTPSGAPFKLLASGQELDAEAAASDSSHFYAIGSHSVKRGSCRENEHSRHLLRFKAADDRRRVIVEEPRDPKQLWSLLKADPLLGAHANKCLGAAPAPGLNIEGLAVHGGRLYIGLRGPVPGGEALVYSVGADALFAGAAEVQPRLDRLPVGGPWGVRDMSAGRDRILLLLGPDDAPATPQQWRIAEWSPPAAPRLLAQLDLRGVRFATCQDDLKPEALAILAESAASYRVLVLSDGVCDGGPLVFDVPR